MGKKNLRGENGRKTGHFEKNLLDQRLIYSYNERRIVTQRQKRGEEESNAAEEEMRWAHGFFL